MRIAFSFRVGMMNAMVGAPGNRPSFQSERAAQSQKVFDRFRGFEPAMGEQAMIANADAQAAGEPPQKDGDSERGPTEVEKGYDRADMKRQHEKRHRPVDWVFVAIDRYLVSHLSP
jgi:hypothetical protein